ncbi:MAG: ureidoglycolate lyase [Candidatus Omnitrophica bacterium]|nr:ureidoglycolate lyase [Candidatus Omnitrophota bacterium]MBU4479177.1 ureidoglycolate lyase [Candidatus Omnitrophota bacterium]MCG2704080.1 ureidoglycolate lyase [Candidatus Omnitrophota bacterium]
MMQAVELKKKNAVRKVRKIAEASFKKYGYIIHWNGHKQKGSGNQFRIITRERDCPGWRIAYLIVRDKEIDCLEHHPGSMESFEPLQGKSILYVCNQKKPRDIEAFMLDKPVVLKKGIWHGVVSVTDEAHVKITENNRVKLVRYKLGYTLYGKRHK